MRTDTQILLEQGLLCTVPHRTTVVALLVALLLVACGGGDKPLATTDALPVQTLSAAAALGEKIFKDTNLSASGRMACSTCHDAALGHASPFTTPVVMGGANLDQPGTRLPPALGYLRFNTPFRIQADGTAVGGFTWDGRADTLADQARRPLLSSNEMANTDVASVVTKLSKAPYAAAFKATFGADIFDNPIVAFDRMVLALERYQREDADFAPFSSKFDAFTAGKTAFNGAESRGLALFNREDKGNCAACHPSTKAANAPGALFTDFTYDSLGVPRNNNIAANADASYFDLGLCGSTRSDLAARNGLCGKFKVPSLRNVALRKRFFHNGQFDSLEQVVRFYVSRDTNASTWYSLDAMGNATGYDDLPVDMKRNVNTTEGPYNRQAGDAPALNESEVQDLVAFLRTLSDGYLP